MSVTYREELSSSRCMSGSAVQGSIQPDMLHKKPRTIMLTDAGRCLTGPTRKVQRDLNGCVFAASPTKPFGSCQAGQPS